MRIGIVTTTYAPSRNGVATSTVAFVRGLRALGHTVRVFAPNHPGAESEPDVLRLPGLRLGVPADYPLLLPVGPIATSRLPLRDLDVVHTMHPFVAGRMALGWARRGRVPLVFTAHTQYHAYVHYAPTPAGPTTWAVRRHVRAFAASADLVLAPGRAMVAALRDYGYAGPVELMPNPVDVAAFAGGRDPGLRAATGVPDDAPLLVYVGRMGPEKGLPLLLEAFERARGARPDLHLWMVGDGPSRAALAARERPGVHWLGPVPHARVAGYLLAADLFVSGSTTEVLPMTFLESLAAGTPVAAVTSDAALDLLAGDLDGMCDPTAEALAAKVLRDVGHPDPASRRALARAAAAAYDLPLRARALAEAYGRAIERHAAGSRPSLAAARG